MDHILSGCEALAGTEYITRHNKAAAYLHWRICQDYDIEVTNRWYEHKPETVMTIQTTTLLSYADLAVNTDRTITVTANRADIVVKDLLTNATCKVIDMTVPSDRNIALKKLKGKVNTKT